MLIDFFKTNRLLHFFTNSFICLNYSLKRGKNNRRIGKLNGIFARTSVTMLGDNNLIEYGKGTKLYKLKIYIKGSDNMVTIGDFSMLDNVTVWMAGDGHRLVLGKKTRINNAELGFQHSKSAIITDDDVMIGGFVQLGLSRSKTDPINIYAFEGTKVHIGEGTRMSDGTTIRTSDSHSIYDAAKKRINYPGDVILGKKTWVGSGVTLLKGAKTGEHCIIGLGSLVTKDFSDSNNVIIAGTPAKIIRENISWGLEI